MAVIPAFLAVALLIFGVYEPERKPGSPAVNPIQRKNLKRLSAAYWWIVVIGAVFTLARFSEAFLVLRAQQSGMALALIPLVMMLMSIVYTLTAHSFGKLSDNMNHSKLLTLDFTSVRLKVK